MQVEVFGNFGVPVWGSPQWCIGSPYIYGNYHGSLLLPKQIRTTNETCSVSSDYFCAGIWKAISLLEYGTPI